MNLPVFLAVLAAAQTTSAQQSPAPQPSIQQQFDAATAALDADNWAEAIRRFEALEANVRNPRTLALSRARRASALAALGRFDEAATTLRQALPSIPAGDASLNEDRFLALRTLGLIAEHDLDYPEALRQYRLAAAIPVGDTGRLLVQRGIIQTQLFTNAEGALRDADATLLMPGVAAQGATAIRGAVHTLKGRALLNLGRFAEARVELETAMRLLGNLTLRVNQADLVARSDLAIAALLSGKPEAARRYLAYTGAGRFERGAITPLHRNVRPQCGTDIAPEDVVVVELAVRADGSVGNVVPIYASRQGPGATMVARVLTGWAFEPESARRLPALLRSVVRLEVRCSLHRPSGRYVEDSHYALRRLAAVAPNWEQAIASRTDRSGEDLRRELELLDNTPHPDPARALPLLLLIANQASIPAAEREAALRQALPMAARLGLPPAVIASIALAIGRQQLAAREREDRDHGLAYRSLIDLPEVRGSAEAMAFIRLARARFLYSDDKYEEAMAIAEAVRSLPEARRGGPLEIEALEIQMAVHAARDEMAEARAAFEAMGPVEGRCGLVPRRRGSGNSTDFPDDAYRWGFEGWTDVELTIAPTGDVAATRAVAAYPPFVFAESARRVMGRTRYEPFVSPNGTPCTYGPGLVRFVIPEGPQDP